MRKYPIGLQDFKGIREDNFLYVDKTRLIHELIGSGKYFFLSRPRRFGKSLLLSTIDQLFNGRKELFKGLWIEEHWNWERKHPVIHLGLSSIGYRSLGLADALEQELDAQATRFGIRLTSKYVEGKFKELIQNVSEKEKVVILIDEYDKPIIDYLEDIAIAEKNREIFKSFYSVLKDADQYIRLLLITGVSRFSKVSIFSDLNNLRDITLSPQYATLAGITQSELETYFAPEIKEMQETDPEILVNIKKWYNGYSWNGVDTVYNPFSLLNFMTDRLFQNFWYATGTPTFLIKQMKERREYKFEETRHNVITLGSFEISNPLSAPLLFQTGYLTIKNYDSIKREYTLDYPNGEVEESLLIGLLSAYRYDLRGDTLAISNDLKDSLEDHDMEKMIRELNALIGSIPFDHWKADSESIFHIIFHLAFKKVGIIVESEVHSSKGRCDVLVKTGKYIYAFELKLNGSPKKALDQVLKKGYLTPYQGDKRKKIALGINFSASKRAVDGWLEKEVVA